ncbi:hypothetical protein JNUCC64_21535 [Streptomyces sp. JNUCC 64]
MNRARLWRTVPAMAVAAALTGCATPLGGGPNCTQMGADSGITLTWRPADFGEADAATVRLCVGKVCEDRSSGRPSEPMAMAQIPLEQDVGAVTVTVRLTVTSVRDGRVLVRDTARPRLARHQPNGAGCPPTAWTAAFRVHPGKGLVSPKGISLR